MDHSLLAWQGKCTVSGAVAQRKQHDPLDNRLKDKKIAIMATDGFEPSELFGPLEVLRAAGATVDIVSDREGEIRAWDKSNWGKCIPVDLKVDSAHSLNYHALVLPGGVMNPDQLRTHTVAVNFVKAFFEKSKIVAAICHAPWLLINAGHIEGRRVTSSKSIRLDVINAGGLWIDEAVVVDNGLITSRKPADLPAFCKALVDLLLEEREGKYHT